MDTFNRRIYQSLGLFVSPTATGQHFSGGNSGTNLLEQLSRIQTLNDGWDVARTNVNQLGQLAPLSREITEAPTVNLSFSYFVTDGKDEARLGLVTSGTGSVGAITNIINKTEAQKNYFIPSVQEGEDLVGQDGQDVVDVRCIGNAFLSSYSVEGSVGGFLTANVAVEGSNAAYHLGGSGNPIPAINPTNGQPVTGFNYAIPLATTGDAGQPIVIKQGDLEVDFVINGDHIGATVTGVGGAHIQSFTLSVPLTREQLQKLGSRYAYDRPITFPVDVSLSVSALTNQITTGDLSDLFCGTDTYDITIRAKQTCGDHEDLIVYTLKGATLDSQNFTDSIGPAETVDLNFTSSIGGPNDTRSNLFISGSFTP
jgi:type VI protein secretion system component Hcp